MRYPSIDPRLFIQNRNRFVQKLKPGSLAVFNSNDIMPTNADGTMPFRQNSDLFYLSGIDQEETTLLLFPDARDEKFREILFVRETNQDIAVWEGKKLTKEQASEQSGIKTVLWTSEFYRMFSTLMAECEYVYLNSNEHLRSSNRTQTRDDRFILYCKEKYPLHKYERSTPIMHLLRSVKSDIETELLRKACEITEKGFRRVLKFIKPGVYEYEVEAEYAHEFIRLGAGFAGYQPIIASGVSTCILHYNSNHAVCNDGDMLLMDVAAGYANYHADMTRTVPVNGRFTARQKDVYNAVFRVMKAAKDLLKPGVMLSDYQKNVGTLVEGELLKLGLLKTDEVKNQKPEAPLYKKYFMHGTSHFLGLDVHDVGLWHLPVQAGMVFTCEPGIYIREEGLGVRLENNIVVGAVGNTDLMATIPVEAEEIEQLMHEQ